MSSRRVKYDDGFLIVLEQVPSSPTPPNRPVPRVNGNIEETGPKLQSGATSLRGSRSASALNNAGDCSRGRILLQVSELSRRHPVQRRHPRRLFGATKACLPEHLWPRSLRFLQAPLPKGASANAAPWAASGAWGGRAIRSLMIAVFGCANEKWIERGSDQCRKCFFAI